MILFKIIKLFKINYFGTPERSKATDFRTLEILKATYFMLSSQVIQKLKLLENPSHAPTS